MIDPNQELDARIARLDELIARRPDAERGLGLRLALGLARELRDGLAPGTETSELVSAWVEHHGPGAVDEAVAQARALLKDPARLAAEIGRRLEDAKAGDDLSATVDPGEAPRA